MLSNYGWRSKIGEEMKGEAIEGAVEAGRNIDEGGTPEVVD